MDIRRHASYSSPDEVAALSEHLRPALLSWARRRFPNVAWDHEEVLQDVLADLTLDPRIRGSEDHVRACIYQRFRCRLLNRVRDERRRASAAAIDPLAALAQTPDCDETIDPVAYALRGCEQEVLRCVLARFPEIEQRLIRMRYRGGTRAQRNDGIVPRTQCAELLGITLSELRSMERRVMRDLDAVLRQRDQPLTIRQERSFD